MLDNTVSLATEKIISVLQNIRSATLTKVENLSEEQAFFIPSGSKNNIHWHVGHILHVQLAHWYVRRGKPLPIDLGFKKYFADGKSPLDYDQQTPSFAQLLEVYKSYSFALVEHYGSILELPMTIPFDYLNGHFATVADDLYLLVFHEGEHHPMLMRLLKALE